ncbi:MAG: hypothetical protein QOJ21_1303, partial [Solirubrobacteraceae bacterium]|nr:hypothetical protein [Solirubrobacteraceae bacterium]
MQRESHRRVVQVRAEHAECLPQAVAERV